MSGGGTSAGIGGARGTNGDAGTAVASEAATAAAASTRAVVAAASTSSAAASASLSAAAASSSCRSACSPMPRGSERSDGASDGADCDDELRELASLAIRDGSIVFRVDLPNFLGSRARSKEQ